MTSLIWYLGVQNDDKPWDLGMLIFPSGTPKLDVQRNMFQKTWRAEIYGKSKEKDDKPTWMWGSHFLFQVDMQRYTPSNGGVSKR